MYFPLFQHHLVGYFGHFLFVHATLVLGPQPGSSVFIPAGHTLCIVKN